MTEGKNWGLERKGRRQRKRELLYMTISQVKLADQRENNNSERRESSDYTWESQYYTYF